MKLIRVALDAGHGGGPAFNRGSVIGNEGDNNFKMSMELKKELEKLGVEVVLSRKKIEDNPSFNDRGKTGTDCNLLLSLHTNAAPTKNKGQASGVEVWDDVNPKYSNKILADKLCEVVSKTLGITNRGTKYNRDSNGKNALGVLFNGKAKSNMLIEFCFHDNFNELNNYLNNLNLVAKNVAAVIFEHFGGKDSIKIPGINISKTVLKTGVVNTSVLNVRSGASATYRVVRQIKLNDKVDIFEISNGWYRIGEQEWVNAAYIKESSIMMKTKYYEKSILTIVETTADNIYIQTIPGLPLHSVWANGISGTFQYTPNASDPASIWSIAVNGGVPLGPNSHTNSVAGFKRGTMICYSDGTVEVLRINNLSEIKKSISWAIGGGSLYPYYDPREEGFTPPFDDVLRKAYHVGIAHKGNKIFAIVSKPCTMGEFKTLIGASLSIDGAVFLDGGGTAQLYYEGQKGLRQFRKLSHMIGFKEV